ncbi:hypothetical protein ACS8YF_06435 [Salinisphaera sp. SWV1]|uniref:hypothetical protein n=1 Tax=Salinisphaera sp. SWV1 TaxID=3454139 RepID=UPI003F8638FF
MSAKDREGRVFVGKRSGAGRGEHSDQSPDTIGLGMVGVSRMLASGEPLLLRGRRTRHPHPLFWGCCLVAIAVCAYAANPVMAVLAFRDGASPLGMVVARSVALLVLLGFGLIRDRPARAGLLGSTLIPGLFMGPIFVLQSYGIFAAVAKAPVGLAMLIYGLLPFWIQSDALSLRDWRRSLRVLVAITAIALAWSQLVNEPRIDGLLWAIVSVVAARTLWIGCRFHRYSLSTAHAKPLLFCTAISALAVSLMLGLTLGHDMLPKHYAGWCDASVLGATYALATLLLLRGLPLLETVSVAWVVRLEWPVSMALAIACLHEPASFWLMSGAAVVWSVSLPKLDRWLRPGILLRRPRNRETAHSTIMSGHYGRRRPSSGR